MSNKNRLPKLRKKPKLNDWQTFLLEVLIVVIWIYFMVKNGGM